MVGLVGCDASVCAGWSAAAVVFLAVSTVLPKPAGQVELVQVPTVQPQVVVDQGKALPVSRTNSTATEQLDLSSLLLSNHFDSGITVGSDVIIKTDASKPKPSEGSFEVLPEIK
jgi:hypothetical protein